VTESGIPILDFTDADLKAALRRAFKTTAIIGVALALALTFVYGWQTGALLLAGTIISATGLWEWQRLVAFINAKLDNQNVSSQPFSCVSCSPGVCFMLV
jgi:fatty acid desaturase